MIDERINTAGINYYVPTYFSFISITDNFYLFGSRKPDKTINVRSEYHVGINGSNYSKLHWRGFEKWNIYHQLL